MNILVTGSNGFVGKNLVASLEIIASGKDCAYSIEKDILIFQYDVDTNPALLNEYCAKADFVYNLAGANRPETQDELMSTNFGFASTLLETLKNHENACPVMLSSSIQATRDNPYGRSKKAGEDLFFEYSRETGAPVFVYRFPNLFGKWCRPNYNSVVATFCSNIAHNKVITINDRDAEIVLLYIDDAIRELINDLSRKPAAGGGFCKVGPTYKVTVGELADLILSFKECRKSLCLPDVGDPLINKLYATYLSYLPENSFSYPLKMNVDDRGSFTEFIRTPDRGQFSVNISKRGITKGNHWHHTKNEKFLVVSGTGVIRFRNINDDQVLEYFVSGDQLEVVDIPTGFTHNIENLGEQDMVTIMWANECFDPQRPDTFHLEV